LERGEPFSQFTVGGAEAGRDCRERLAQTGRVFANIQKIFSVRNVRPVARNNVDNRFESGVDFFEFFLGFVEIAAGARKLLAGVSGVFAEKFLAGDFYIFVSAGGVIQNFCLRVSQFVIIAKGLDRRDY